MEDLEGLLGYKVRVQLRNGLSYESGTVSVEETDFEAHGQMCEGVLFSGKTTGGQLNLELNTGGRSGFESLTSSRTRSLRYGTTDKQVYKYAVTC